MPERTCRVCLSVIPLESFYKHPSAPLGRMTKCKECHKSQVRANRAANVDRYRASDRERSSRPERKRNGRRVLREYRKAHPLRAKANGAVARHVRAGNLRAKPCENCGAVKTVAHHDDYSTPLDVMWLCQACHKARHAELDARGHDYKG